MTDPDVAGRVDAVIFDLGKVIVDWNPAYLLKEIVPDDAKLTYLVEEVLDLEWFRAVDAGYPLAKAIAERAALYPDYAESLQAYVDRWPETIRGTFDDVVAMVAELGQAGYPLYVLSNWASETWARVHDDLDFLAYFDDVVISGHVGVSKPDQAIFELARDRFDVAPVRTLFIDDSPANVDAARECGFQAVLFESPSGLRRDLVRYGLLSG